MLYSLIILFFNGIPVSEVNSQSEQLAQTSTLEGGHVNVIELPHSFEDTQMFNTKEVSNNLIFYHILLLFCFTGTEIVFRKKSPCHSEKFSKAPFNQF